MALEKSGYYDKAYKTYQMINPINRSKKKELSDKYYDEPYVIAADIYSSESFPAHGGWTWYTGSAGWFYRVGLEDILGIKVRGERLVLEPHMPVAWDGYKAKYHYGQTTYEIEVIKGNKEELVIDSKSLSVRYIKLNDDRRTHYVKLYVRK